MNVTDRDLERLLRAACPPIEPAPPLRRRVLAAAPRRRPAGRVLRLAAPFAAGVLCVLAAQRLAVPAGESAAGAPSSSSVALPAWAFERIADRAPPPTPVRDDAPPHAPIELAAAPVPRIS